MKTKFIFGAAVAALFSAGCGTSSDKIYFASEVKAPSAMVSPEMRVKGLAKADEEQVDMLVLSYLLDRVISANNSYTALFLQADDTVVAAMMKKYARQQPPIKPSERIDLRSKQSPLDKDTGKPVMILGAEVNEPNADGTVDVIGRWFAGGVVQGFHTFTLKKTGEDWSIASVK
ncbi:MAG: hypothetical protein WCK57_10365 [Verrucomicrobiae bacterium]